MPDSVDLLNACKGLQICGNEYLTYLVRNEKLNIFIRENLYTTYHSNVHRFIMNKSFYALNIKFSLSMKQKQIHRYREQTCGCQDGGVWGKDESGIWH